jgi:hypothetical protein
MIETNPIEALFESARRHKVSMSRICERAGVAPTTPSRWKQGKNGATVEAVSKLQSALAEIVAEARQ